MSDLHFWLFFCVFVLFALVAVGALSAIKDGLDEIRYELRGSINHREALEAALNSLDQRAKDVESTSRELLDYTDRIATVILPHKSD